MSRNWTREGLDAAHPEVKAAGWTWRVGHDGTPLAALFVGASERNAVWVGRTGRLCFALDDPPVDIAIAVGLASKGLDSLGAMAARLDTRAQEENERCISLEPGSPEWHYANSCQRGLTEAFPMLRRGKVEP